MCQPKSKGGRRCLRHSSASRAEVNYVSAKLKLDKETVYATLKELNKEGRKLDPPTKEEVLAFIKEEEFKVKYDPDENLTTPERARILKALGKAQGEVQKNGATAGALHAWKNLLSRCWEKVGKKVAALGAIGAMVFGLTSCSVGTTSSTEAANDSPVACSASWDGYGAMEPDYEVTDELGTYCVTKISDTAYAFSEDSMVENVNGDTLTGVFSTEQVAAAQTNSLNYLTQILDTKALEELDSVEGTSRQNIIDNIDYSNVSASEEMKDGGDEARWLVLGSMESGVRDGQSRLANTTLKITNYLGASSDDGSDIIVTKVIVNTDLRATDEAVKNTYNYYNDTWPDYTPGSSWDEVLSDFPFLNDGEENYVPVTRTYYFYTSGDGELVGVKAAAAAGSWFDLFNYPTAAE